MKWSKTIPFAQPVRAVSLAPPAGSADADAKLREREEQAYARGVVEGEQRLGEQLLQQRNELLQLHNGVLHSLRQAVGQVTRDAENALIEIAFTAAQRIVAEVPISHELVEANVRAALAQGEEATEFFIHLHPDDLALLQHHTSDLLSTAPRQERMHFLPAPEIARGGCLVRTQFGVIDARRETRLERVRQTLAP
jgi:flagellar assembly protein FliH